MLIHTIGNITYTFLQLIIPQNCEIKQKTTKKFLITWLFIKASLTSGMHLGLLKSAVSFTTWNTMFIVCQSQLAGCYPEIVLSSAKLVVNISFWIFF